MRLCFLKGLTGDAINAVLAAAGSNLQKLLQAFAHALLFWLGCFLSAVPCTNVTYLGLYSFEHFEFGFAPWLDEGRMVFASTFYVPWFKAAWSIPNAMTCDSVE